MTIKRLIHCRSMGDYSLRQIEAPFFAVYEVARGLSGLDALTGLSELMISCGVSEPHRISARDRQKILEKVEEGEWLLVSAIPFSPLSDDTSGRYSTLASRDFPCTGPRLRNVSSEPSSVVAGEMPLILNQPRVGPGKWRLRNIEYDRVKNTFLLIANRLTSGGEEGRVFGAEGKDYSNTTRTLIHEWLPLNEEEKSFSDRSVQRRYGELHRTRQSYVDAPDHWQISGSSWHWTPVTANTVYEFKKEK